MSDPVDLPSWLLVVAHDDAAPPGLIGEWAGLRGLHTEVVRADATSLPEPWLFDHVVLLGAAPSVHDLHLPWLRRERAWLTRALEETAVLGIGFGAQLLALTLGGRVRRMTTPEVGWTTVMTHDAAAIPSGPWPARRNDLVVPPEGSEVLAANGRGVQAFATGPHVGVLFHPHVTPAIGELWATRGFADEAARAPFGAPAERDRLLARCADDGIALLDAFAQRARRTARPAP